MAVRLSVTCALVLTLSTSACEVVADFDPKKLDEDSTIGPVPIPSLDGSTALMPDAALVDGAQIRPVQPDAEVRESEDAGLDASPEGAATDAASDGAASASDDAGNGDAATGDLGFADASVD